MKTKTTLLILVISIIVLLIGFFAVRSLLAPDTEEESSDLDITQAYQTVDAQLTEAVAQTPSVPTNTSPPSPTGTPTSSETPNPEQLTGTPSGPTATVMPSASATVAARCDRAEAAFPNIDITIPDDTEIPAGSAFTKVWRVVNMGTCNWTAEYAAVFVDGEQMGAPDEVFIDEPVAPGQSIDIDVDMVAPQQPGTYQGDWMLRNPNGDIFGIGPNANDSFWVRIVVVEADETPTPTASTVPDPDVLVSGSATLNADDSIDLDTLQLNTSGADLAYQQIKADDVITGHQMVPLSGVAIGIYGAGQPTFENCKATDMGAATIDLQAAAPGTHYCHTTNQGMIGWSRFDDLDEENGVVALTVLTWAASE